MKIVQISGKAGIGKDSFARQLYIELTNEGKKCLILHYADAIKDIARKIFGWNGMKDEIGRKLLQEIGTEKGRKIDKNLWIKELHLALKFAETEYDYVIVPDCRYINEIEYWKTKTKYDSMTVRLNRENFVSDLTQEAQKHQSEIDLDNYEDMENFTISGKLEDLSKHCKEFIKKYNF